MSVSVVMIVRNGSRFLDGAIDSVVAQTRAADEILVVDGGSTDATTDIAARRGVQVVQQPRSGIADARNHGIAHTGGTYIAFLDHDDRWMPQKLQRQLAVMERTGVDYCVTNLRRIPAGGGVDVHAVFERFAHGTPTLGLTPSTVVVRRSAFAKIGLFDGAQGHGCDAAWFARAIDTGARRHDLDEVLVEKLLHDRNTSIDTAGTRRALLRIARESVRSKRAERAGRSD